MQPDDTITEDGYRTTDLSREKNTRRAILAVAITWRCALCGHTTSHPNPRRLRTQAQAHAATHPEGSCSA